MPLRLDTIAQSQPYRVLFAAIGGYAFTAGFFACLSVVLAFAGTARIEAMYWSILTSFPVFTGVVIWVAATARPLRVSAVIAVSAALMICGSPLLASRLGPA
ncbi:MAG: iron uptake protein [Pseudomonadota bacterium]